MRERDREEFFSTCFMRARISPLPKSVKANAREENYSPVFLMMILTKILKRMFINKTLDH